MALQEQSNLSARVSRVTNQLAESLETLDAGVRAIDTALFGHRPMPTNAEGHVGEPTTDSIESNVARLERLQARCIELLKFTGEFRSHVDGSNGTQVAIERPMASTSLPSERW